MFCPTITMLAFKGKLDFYRAFSLQISGGVDDLGFVALRTNKGCCVFAAYIYCFHINFHPDRSNFRYYILIALVLNFET